MGATCIVGTSQRCDAPTDGEHSRVRFRAGRWERWHYVGLWVTTSREAQRPAKVRPPSLAELAASVPRLDAVGGAR